ncbi:MAG: tRNA pseudouridine(38-40) synthase TruA [Verrucomicrobiota bacterium]
MSIAIRNHKIIIAYDGTVFSGWQRQGLRPTVQLAIEEAMRKCWPGEKIVLHGSGRTDTGVHANGQTASFKATAKFKLPVCRSALNNNLPASVRILSIRFVPDDFHARFSAKGKEYLYKVYNNEVMPPLEINRFWHLPRTLDIDLMREAAEHLIGEHDFASFTSNPGYDRHSTVRTIYDINFRKSGSRVTIRFYGSGFLYRMVRNLTGIFAKVGQARISPSEVRKILRAEKRSAAPATAPAHGLYLNKVYY